MKAGVGSVCITPDRPIWMAGFAERDKPSEGTYQDLFGKALEDLEPARLWQGQGSCTLAVNRRRPLPDDPTRVSPSLLPNPQGATDADVPVLKVVRTDGSTKAVVFLYACHPTTIVGYLL